MSDERRNKPRVFLSHSKSDIAFIERIAADLRHCMIDPWLDSEEIRHGRPWLEEIFEGGMPACDVVLVYWTKNSVTSKMVKKEVDAALVRLGEDNIALLPYVPSDEFRSQLRDDLQTLQTNVWNEDNYGEMLPRVVAQVWCNYLDRRVAVAIQKEKAARLQAELDLERLRGTVEGGVFPTHEEAEFAYIWKNFEREISVTSERRNRQGGETSTQNFIFKVQFQTLISGMDGPYAEDYVTHNIPDIIRKVLLDQLPKINENEYWFTYHLGLARELQTFGFISLSRTVLQGDPFTREVKHLDFTEKWFRFRTWLGYHQKLMPDLKWRIENPC